MTVKIMLVDDDRTMVALLKTLLELDGYEVVQPPDFANLIGSIKESNPSLILMDVFLKDADGVDLLREVRSDPALGAIPVVMTSGMDMSDQCQDAGASAFVLKPYDPETLASVIQNQLQGSRD